MHIGLWAFYLFAALTLASAAMVVFLRNVVYAAFSLFLTFFGVAGLSVFLGADFLAATQVMLYVGGILILIVFGVMLTRKVMDVEVSKARVNFPQGLILSAFLLAVLLGVVWKTRWPAGALAPQSPTTKTIGTLLMTDYLLPFEAVSLLLLGALIGAALLARKEG